MKKAKTILLISAFLLTFIVTKQINVMQDTEEIWKSIEGYSGIHLFLEIVVSIGGLMLIWRDDTKCPYIVNS